MPKDFSDLSTRPLPVAGPRSRRQALRVRWFLLALILVLLGLGAGTLIAFLVSSSHAQISHTSVAVGAGSTVTVSTPGSTPAATTASSTPTRQPASVSTLPAGAPGVTHGRPHLGGPLTDFVGKYGSPDSQGDVGSVNFWVGSTQSIVLNVSINDQGQVTQIVVTGDASWTGEQTTNYCVQFLPGGAVQKSATSTLLIYSSSAGTIHLTLQTTSSCSLVFARS